VIDWCNAYWLDLPAEQRFASSSLDLAAFLISLFCHRFLVTRAIPGLERLAESFLACYAADRGDGFQLPRLRSDLPEIAGRWHKARVQQAGWARAACTVPDSIGSGASSPAPAWSGEATMTVSYRDSHLSKGADYHDTFTMLPHRAMQWRMERRCLSTLVRRRFAGRKPAYLDFACGTGRVLGYLAPQVSHAVGVDVSASMLAEARENAPGAELVAADLDRTRCTR
jgi:hypothetical protein